MEDLSAVAERIAHERDFSRETCAYCDGSGDPKPDQILGGEKTYDPPCKSCMGTGHVWRRRDVMRSYSDEALVREFGDPSS